MKEGEACKRRDESGHINGTIDWVSDLSRPPTAAASLTLMTGDCQPWQQSFIWLHEDGATLAFFLHPHLNQH